MKAIGRLGLALALLFCALTPAQAVERILFFLSDVRVQHNGDLQVTETIRVPARSLQRKGKIEKGFFRS